MLAVPATKHGTLLHHAVMLQLSDATRALLLAGESVVSHMKLELLVGAFSVIVKISPMIRLRLYKQCWW